jgi:lipoprotein-releasing system permease protein
MFRPAAIFIGLRYTRSKRGSQFISLISMISMLGITLGVIVLITVLSVLNGFDREIKKQVFGMISPITISSFAGGIDDWEEVEKTVQSSPDVTAVAPFIYGQALITNSDQTQPVMLTGIIPEQEKKISALSDKMIQGRLSALKPGSFGIILGEDLARKLGVTIGDSIIVATTKSTLTSSTITPHFRKFTVSGIFRAGGGRFGFDAKLAFINLRDAQTLFDLGKSITALHLNVKDIYAAPEIARTIQGQLSPSARVGDWTMQLGDFFENIRMTKTMMFFIFILIITVAVFNLISTMVMVVKNKQSDIAILRTLGATPMTILTIFIVQGAMIGTIGIVLGIIGGVALAHNITAISIWIQQAFHVQLLSSNVYFVNYLPSELQWPDVWIISIAALALSLLATLYPAWNASRLAPAEALNSV